MKKHPIQKLLAVVTFVGATSTAIAAPRTLANGAPAPGNTVAKGYQEKQNNTAVRRMAEARAALAAALAEEREATNALATQPRTLPNGAPACGNTGGKAPVCTAEMAEGMHAARIERARAAADWVARARAKLHEASRKVAQQQLDRSVIEDDYS